MPKAAYYIPTQPYSPIDALNRRAAAVGSPGYAMATAHANYNGHSVRVSWNSYRRYYIAEYTWSGRQVIARGSFENVLTAALRFNRRDGLGTSLKVWPREDDDDAIALCESTEALQLYSRDSAAAHFDSWYTWRHRAAAGSVRDYAHPGKLVLHFDWELMQATGSHEEYVEALKTKHKRTHTR